MLQKITFHKIFSSTTVFNTDNNNNNNNQHIVMISEASCDTEFTALTSQE